MVRAEGWQAANRRPQSRRLDWPPFSETVVYARWFGDDVKNSTKGEIAMLKKYFFFIAGMMLLACPAFAGQLHAVCNTVADGDTLLITANGKQYTLQLAYIVAPEPQQKFGAEAKQFLESLALNQQLRVTIISSKEDSITGEVFSSKKQDPINQELVRKGLAWPVLEKDKKHPYDLSVSFAQKRLLGVWSDPQLKPPSQKDGSDVKKAALAPHKEGAAGEAPQTPSTGAPSSNFLMRQGQNVNKVNAPRGAQE
jgi:micrococcal nuclease